MVQQGVLKSPNFVHNLRGWQVDSDGNAELNNLQIKNNFITVPLGADIQSAINTMAAQGGGEVRLGAGTYTLTSSLVVPSNVSLVGLGLVTVIDCANDVFQIQVVGSNNYSTGTVAIANDGTTVTGTGTTFTSAMEGQQILLEDFWYTILTFTDATHLQLDRPYMGTTLSGASYMIATTVGTVVLKDFLIQNSTDAGIKFQYANGLTIDGVVSFNCANGLDGDDSSFINLLNGGSDTCTTTMTFNNVYFGTLFNCNYTACTNGASFVSIRNWCIDVFAFVNISGTAMSFTNCSNNDILDFSIQHITGKGIEFVSGNSDMGVSAGVIKDCTSDGMKLTATSDAIQLGAGLSIHDNGGYGINIAASTCDNNVIDGNYFSTNTSGNVNNLGTGTVKTGNSPTSVNDAVTDANLSTSDVTTNNVTSTKHGFAPKSPADATKFLNGAATPDYAQVKDSDLSTSDITTNDVSITKHGFVPKAPNDTTKFLRGDGTWNVPSSGSSVPLFRWNTFFENSGRWSTNNVSGTETWGLGVLLDTTATGSRQAEIFSALGGGTSNNWFAGSPVMYANFHVATIPTTGTAYIVIGDSSGLTTPHFGFLVDVATGTASLKGTCANATTQSKTAALTTLANTDNVEVCAKMNSTTSIDFYWRKNGGSWSTATSLSTNIPNSTNQPMADIRLNNTTGQLQVRMLAMGYER